MRTLTPDLTRARSESPSGSYSPRTKIARKLQCIELDEDSSVNHETHSPRKRTKLSTEAHMQEEPRRHSISMNDSLILEPELQSNGLNSSFSLDTDGRYNPYHRGELSSYLQTSKSDSSRRLHSPPPPGHKDADVRDLEGSIAPTAWQDTEITGMAIDFAAGDDGEGINGIAFRPSPQTAQARRQRRRQQIFDWKTREEREARVKRHERRNGCKLGSDREKKRLVRFVEPDGRSF